MFEVYKFNESEIALFTLMLIRISSCFTVMPIFGGKIVPNPAKVLIALVVTLVLFPVLSKPNILPLGWTDEIIVMALREAVFGVFLGFLTRLVFMGVEMAGQIVGLSMGLSTAQLVNPQFQESSGIIEQFKNMLATLLFLAINGHHLMLEALYKSFELMPLAHLNLNPKSFASMTFLLQEISIIAIKLAGPMMAVALFMTLAVGVIGRVVPQINVFVVSFPVNVLAGLFIFIVSVPLMLTVLEADILRIGTDIFKFLKNY